MTIEEAIEVLSDEIRGWSGKYYERKDCALNLGIESLKAIKAHRKDFRKGDIYCLPGETED